MTDTGLNTGLNTAFIKAHGTENDFVVLVDPRAQLDLTEDRVRAIANRRAGIGGDGVIRVATAETLLAAGVLEELPEGVNPEEWFMDYRNADGSVAEMCGNGVRVFAHVLVAESLVTVGPAETGPTDSDPLVFGVGTRAGRKEVRVFRADATSADVQVDMGTPEVLGLSTAFAGDMKVAGLAVDMGNPHLAAVVPGLDAQTLDTLPVAEEVRWDPEFFPAGVNLEVVTPINDGAVHMRVHERGVGETRSCGTGTVAAAVAALADANQAAGTVRVNVPGGTVEVEVGEGFSTLRGPSTIVARGTTYLVN